MRLAVAQCHARGPVDNQAIALRRSGSLAELSRYSQAGGKIDPRTLYLLDGEATAWQRGGPLQLEWPRSLAC